MADQNTSSSNQNQDDQSQTNSSSNAWSFATYGDSSSTSFQDINNPNPPAASQAAPTNQTGNTANPPTPTPNPVAGPNPAVQANQTAEPNPAPQAASPFGQAQGSSPFGDDTPFGQNPPPGAQPPKEEDNTPANFQIGTKLPKVINITIPAHNLSFDEQNFLHLLAGSISLTKDEKKRIIESIPKLKQSQIDELIRIFEEERRKFAELSAKHVEQLKKLDQQHFTEWQALELEQKAQEKKNRDEAQAEELRKKLGL